MRRLWETITQVFDNNADFVVITPASGIWGKVEIVAGNADKWDHDYEKSLIWQILDTLMSEC